MQQIEYNKIIYGQAILCLIDENAAPILTTGLGR